MTNPDFCAFILTNGRPDRVYTYQMLRLAGYTGPIRLVIDDEDPSGPEYRKRYGDEVIVFSKAEYTDKFDLGDNNHEKRNIVTFARTAVWTLAKQVGCKWFIMLDDDYTQMSIRFNSQLQYIHLKVRHSADALFASLVEFLEVSGALTVAMSQGGGDHFGGGGGRYNRDGPMLLRKAMNSFVCRTDRPFYFMGRLNEDVTTYVTEGRRGVLFFTVMQAQVNQLATQSNAGGLTTAYLESGTYFKTFYSVMFCPSAVRVGTLSDPRSPHVRIHHKVNWNACAPKIIREEWRKARAE
jgi:hypothetical protein